MVSIWVIFTFYPRAFFLPAPNYHGKGISVYSFQVNWGMWGLPKMVCDFYIALDVVCSTSSIFNLVAISIDR